MTMKLKRLAPGHYRSADGRVTIRRIRNLPYVSYWWQPEVDGAGLQCCWTKADAVNAAERELARKDGAT